MAAEGYEVRVASGGSSLTLKFAEDESTSSSSSVFHAPWLWENRPTNIHPTSGQRLNSKSQCHGWRIAAAEIVEQPTFEGNNDDEHSTSSSSSNNEQPLETNQGTANSPPLQQQTLPRHHRPPHRGCLHSIGNVYRTAQQHQHKQATKKMLQVTWKSKHQLQNTATKDSDPSTTNNVSYYGLDWLKNWRYDESAIIRRRQMNEIRKEHAICRTSDLVEIDYHQLMNDESNNTTLLQTLHSIIQHGAVLIKNAPLVFTGPDAPVTMVGRKMTGGSLSHGYLYGDLFHVKSISDAHNVAYTPLPIPPHQDLSYYESKPGLQLLHCIKDSSSGGESFLMDAMAAANELRNIAPHFFQTLVQCRATFMKQREGGDMVYTRPHIVVGGRRRCDSDDGSGDIISINWSPPFQGPAYDIPSHRVEDYYEAYTAFELMLDNSLSKEYTMDLPQSLQEIQTKLQSYANDYTWEKRLQPGDMLVFNNQRMLHGRRGFKLSSSANGNSDGGQRHLVGCYTNAEETLNQYRLLLRECEHNESTDDYFVIKNFGNGSSGTN